MAYLTCQGLTKEYLIGGVPVPVLNGIDLALEPGEFVAVMGQSGSGKSTLLHCLGLLETPTAGEICLAGCSVGDLSDREKACLRWKSIGFVFQFFYLVPGLTVWENVLLPLLIGGKKAGRFPHSQQDRQVLQMLQRVGLEHRLHHKPAQLSGGEQQRAAIARALINNPALLLLDEPTGNLDSATSEDILALFSDICCRDRITTLMVTHSQQAAAHCSRIIHIRDGRISETGCREFSIRRFDL